MPNSTGRLGLALPLGTDNVSELRVAINANATTLDAAATITEGTAVSRPSTSVYGKFYYATDTGQLSFYNGSAWEAVPLAGAWSTIALPAGFATGSGGGQWRYRIEGDVVRVAGGILNNTNASVTQLFDGLTTIFPVIPTYSAVLSAQINYTNVPSGISTTTATTVLLQGNTGLNGGATTVADAIPAGNANSGPTAELIVNGTFPLN